MAEALTIRGTLFILIVSMLFFWVFFSFIGEMAGNYDVTIDEKYQEMHNESEAVLDSVIGEFTEDWQESAKKEGGYREGDAGGIGLTSTIVTMVKAPIALMKGAKTMLTLAINKVLHLPDGTASKVGSAIFAIAIISIISAVVSVIFRVGRV